MASCFSVEAIPQLQEQDPHHPTVKDDDNYDEKEEVNENRVEQVRLTVPITDDPTQPVLTFRTSVLGILACAIMAFVNQFFGYRQNQLFVSSVSAQIVVLPLDKLMAATLPVKRMASAVLGFISSSSSAVLPLQSSPYFS